MQHNRIKDPDVVGIFSVMKDLRVLYLQGNPVVKHIQHYRKALVSKCTNLKYLDDRSVLNQRSSYSFSIVRIFYHALGRGFESVSLEFV